MDLWDAGALGVVETSGLTAAIVAVDVMAKAAEVTVIGVRRIGNGLVTVSVIGDVASVTAAVESARRAVAAVGGRVEATVIGRPAVPASLLGDPDRDNKEDDADRHGAEDGPSDGDCRSGGDGASDGDGRADGEQGSGETDETTGDGRKARSARSTASRRRRQTSGTPAQPDQPTATPGNEGE